MVVERRRLALSAVDLTEESSRDVVLPDFGTGAADGSGALDKTLAGLASRERAPAVAVLTPRAVSRAAELFTTSLRFAVGLHFARS